MSNFSMYSGVLELASMERDIIFVLKEISGCRLSEAKEDFIAVRALIRNGKLNARTFLEDIGLEMDYLIVLI